MCFKGKVRFRHLEIEKERLEMLERLKKHAQSHGRLISDSFV